MDRYEQQLNDLQMLLQRQDDEGSREKTRKKIADILMKNIELRESIDEGEINKSIPIIP